MKSLNFLMVMPLLLASCLGVRPSGDVILDTSPSVAAAGAYLVTTLGISKPVWIQDSEALAEQNLLGESWPSGDLYVVLIRADLDEVQKWMVLEHELAHVLVWDEGGHEDESDHGPAWGLAFARVHRAATHEDTPNR